MKKTVNINLGGIAFIIDENAFELLHNYLEALRRKFNNEAERTEILSDIESRLAEMLSLRLTEGRKEVVSIEDVEQVTAAMGKPEDIGGEETAEPSAKSTNSGSSNTTNNTTGPVKRRLFRDTDDKILGGVIAGLCHYFGINDPVWVRLVVVLLVILGAGTPILIYILLYLIVPEAETAAEKLQMKGEPVNISTIEKEIKDAANRAGDSISSVFKGNTPFDRLAYVTGRVMTITLKVAAIIVIFIALCMMFGVIAGFSGLAVFTTMPFSDLSTLVVDSTGTLLIFSLGFIFFFGAPLVALIYLALRFLLNTKTVSKPLMWSLLGLWWVGLFMMIFSGAKTVNNYKDSATLKEIVPLAQPMDSSILFVQLTDANGTKISMDDDEEEELSFGVVVDGKDVRTPTGYRINEIDFQVMPSTSDSFELQKFTTTRGRDRADAERNIHFIKYNTSQKENVLNLPQYIEISKAGKWRAQSMKVRLVIPEGKKVKFADNMDRVSAIVKGDHSYDDTYFANTTWTVENGRVKCLDCDQQQRNIERAKKDSDDEDEHEEHKGKASKGDF